MANGFEFNLNNYVTECKKLLKGNGYGIEIILARKLNSDNIIELLKTNQYTRRSDDTLKIIKDSCSGVDEIQCEALKVPLTCVITRKVIDIPLVGLKCKHVACFEGRTFLEMHKNKQEYVCVICYNLIRRNELVRDPLIEDILSNTQRKVEQN